jgi:hypothetical protein
MLPSSACHQRGLESDRWKRVKMESPRYALNYVELNRAYVDGQTVDLDGEAGGVITSLQMPETATTLYMRIVKDGTTCSAYCSPDGKAWELAGHYAANLHSPQSGLGAANGLAGVPEIGADFVKVEATSARFFLPVIGHK